MSLHGANLQDNLNPKGEDVGEAITEAEADDLAIGLSMNFVRLRLSWQGTNRDDGDPTGWSAGFRAKLDKWVSYLSARKIWILLEVRSDLANTEAAFYDPTSALFGHYQVSWMYVAGRFAKTDYIAGYGLLAEPNLNKFNAQPAKPLVAFQKALMDSITTIDPATPFFVGTDFNYDTLQYTDTQNVYFNDLAAYQGRLIYEVNFLQPKPWINDGSVPAGAPAGSQVYPQPDLPKLSDYNVLITPKAGEEKFPVEKIFNLRRDEPAMFPVLMSRDFIRWYLHFASDFADLHQVPMIVDQFGASTQSEGQLTFEKDVIEIAEKYKMGWSRWTYNGTDSLLTRTIENNPSDVYPFYAKIGAARPGPLARRGTHAFSEGLVSTPSSSPAIPRPSAPGVHRRAPVFSRGGQSTGEPRKLSAPHAPGPRGTSVACLGRVGARGRSARGWGGRGCWLGGGCGAWLGPRGGRLGLRGGRGRRGRARRACLRLFGLFADATTRGRGNGRCHGHTDGRCDARGANLGAPIVHGRLS